MKDNYDQIYNEVFKEYFTDLRKNKRYTRKYVSERIGIKQPTYTCYEQGLRTCPLSVFKKLCSLYNLDFLDTFRQLDEIVSKRVG